MLTDVTLRLTLNASTPAWMTGAKTVSLSLVSANMSGIWSRRLERRGTRSRLGCCFHQDFISNICPR